MQVREERRVLGEIVVVVSEVFEDACGFFLEVFREEKFQGLGLPGSFLQENHLALRQNVLQGLPFQWEPPMGKLVRVTRRSASRPPPIFGKVRQHWGAGSGSKYRARIGKW